MEAATASTNQTRSRWPLHTQVLLGLLVGSVAGLLCNYLAGQGLLDRAMLESWANVADPLGRIFLRLILMVVIPLVVSALALGVLELGDVRHLGRIGLRTLGYTLLLSGIAVSIGLGLANTIQPGKSLSAEQQQTLQTKYGSDTAKVVARVQAVEKEMKDQGAIEKIVKELIKIIPDNPLQEAVGALDGSSKGAGMLSVMFFALVLGGALAVGGERTATLVSVLEGVFDVTMVVIGFAMKIAPYGVTCLLFSITARLGIDILAALAWFVATALGGMLLQQFVVYGAVVWLVAGRSPVKFFRDVSDAMLTAFGTSSSNATLPTAIRVADEQLKLPQTISRFVLTIGSTANQNGTALYEGVVVLFLAQVFGVDLSFPQQVTVVLMSMLAGVGTAGIPGGSIPMIAVVLNSVGVSENGIAIILGVDRVLDMCRTVLNVTGDLVLAACVARGEKNEPTPLVA